MKIPSFESFLSTISPHDIEEIMNDAKLKCSNVSEMGLGEQIAAISWTISLELLALYHIWIEGLQTE